MASLPITGIGKDEQVDDAGHRCWGRSMIILRSTSQIGQRSIGRAWTTRIREVNAKLADHSQPYLTRFTCPNTVRFLPFSSFRSMRQT